MVLKNDGAKLACFFDSGIGGLPLLLECCKKIPYCRYAYFADNYNMPYGEMPHAEILKRVDEKFSVMAAMEPDIAVVACNTVTAECIGYLREKYKFPIVGVQPAIKPAAAEHENCVVLATPVTAAGKSLENLVLRYGRSHTKILPCRNLAKYIEDHADRIKAEELAEILPKVECDCVVLGCTHYTYASKEISDFYSAPVYDGLAGTAARIEKILGIFDHRGKIPLDVTFYGGDYAKNAYIFNFLSGLK